MAEHELRTALSIAVPEAVAAVDHWRERTSDAKPSSGVPPHVTILFPFVPPAAVGEALLEELARLFGAFESFAFELRAARRFPGVLYLAPDPAEPFRLLTAAVSARYPECPPYGGAFDAIVPHLTAAEGDPDVLNEAEAEVQRALPIAAIATEVVLFEEVAPDPERWVTRARLPLGPSKEALEAPVR